MFCPGLHCHSKAFENTQLLWMVTILTHNDHHGYRYLHFVFDLSASKINKITQEKILVIEITSDESRYTHTHTYTQ